jgi:hypothetical protein
VRHNIEICNHYLVFFYSRMAAISTVTWHTHSSRVHRRNPHFRPSIWLPVFAILGVAQVSAVPDMNSEVMMEVATDSSGVNDSLKLGSGVV